MNEPIQSLLSKCLCFILKNKEKYNEEQLSITNNILKNIYTPIYYEEYKVIKQNNFHFWYPTKQILFNTVDYFHICSQTIGWSWGCKCKFIIEKKYGGKYQLYWILRCSCNLNFKCDENPYNLLKIINNKLK